MLLVYAFTMHYTFHHYFRVYSFYLKRTICHKTACFVTPVAASHVWCLLHIFIASFSLVLNLTLGCFVH